MNGGSDGGRAGHEFRPSFVYFDLDDTLLDHSEAERAALRDLACDLLGLDGDPAAIARLQETYHERNRKLWADYASGRITKDELRRSRFQPVAETVGRGKSWSELDSFYMARYADHWRPIDGAMEVFEDVSARYPVGIITNGFADTQHAKLGRFPLFREVAHAVVISEEVGYLKPDPRLFAEAEERAGVPGESILYVGDSLSSDVRGALGAGWRAAWYTRAMGPADLPEDVFVFRTWSELAIHLGGEGR